MERWATFDCYGTLVDWNAGIRRELEKLFGVELADGLLVRYHELEPQIQADNPGASYREVLTIALERLAVETGLTLPEGEASALARSLPSWPVFEDVHAGLDGGAGARLAARRSSPTPTAISSTRRWRRSACRSTSPIVAGEIGSYKPAHRHWEVFYEHDGRPTRRGTSTSRRASSTTSRPRPSSGSRRSGSTGSESRRTRAASSDARLAGQARGHARRARSCGSERAARAREEDAEEVARLHERELARAGRSRTTSVATGRLPGFDRERDARLEAGAYAHVDALRRRTGLDRSSRTSRPLRLLDWAEQRARERGGRILSGGWTTNEAVLDELAPSGFGSIRTRSGCRSTSTSRPPAPVPAGRHRGAHLQRRRRARVLRGPAGVVRGLLGADRGDLRGVGALGARRPVLRPRALVSCVAAGRMPPASRSATCMPVSRELGWVRLLGVRQAWRGRGLGRALLLTAFAELRARGHEARGPRRGRRESDRRARALRVCRDARDRSFRDLREGQPRELASRALPGLPDVHRGRGRRRLRVSQLRKHVLGGARARSCARGAPAARRWPTARAFRSRIPRSRSSSATRSTSRPPRSRTRYPQRPIVLGGCCCYARRSCVGPCATRRPARNRLDRRARRPEHARDVSLGEPLGDAVPDAARRRRRRTRRRSARRRPQPRSAGSRVRRAGRDRRLARPQRSQGSTPRTSRSTSTCSTRTRSTCSFPSPTGLLRTRSTHCSATIAGRTRIVGNGRHGLARATERNAASARADARRGRLLEHRLDSSPCLPGRVASTSRSRASARTSRPRARRIRTRAPAAGRTTAMTS